MSSFDLAEHTPCVVVLMPRVVSTRWWALLWATLALNAGTVDAAPRWCEAPSCKVASPAAFASATSSHPQRLLRWLDSAPEVKAAQPLVEEAAVQSGVDPELLKAVIAVESRYRADAVSPQGALGLMQLTAASANRYATAQERRTPAARRLLDARVNIRTGARMLADLTHRYGGIDIALAAWNAGEGAVRRAGGRMPAIAETEAHVLLVLELYWALLQRSSPQYIERMRRAQSSRNPG